MKVIEIYSQNEQKCRKYTKLIMSYILIHETVFRTFIVRAIYCFAIGAPFQLPLNMELFVDINKPFGFGLMSCCQFMTALCYALAVIPITAYFVCCSLYITAIWEYFKTLIELIGKDVKLLQDESQELRSQISISKRSNYTSKYSSKSFGFCALVRCHCFTICES